MIILGIDPGLGRTGWGIVEKNKSQKLKTKGFGCIETQSGLDTPSRLLRIFREINIIVDEYKPDIAAIEKLFFNTNVTTAMSVGEARGVVVLALARMGVPIEEFTPLQVKQAITGYGQATKEQMQKMVKTLLQLDAIPKPDDAADALAVAITLSATPKI